MAKNRSHIKRKRLGKPKNTWKRIQNKELKKMDITWYEIKIMARNRKEQKEFID